MMRDIRRVAVLASACAWLAVAACGGRSIEDGTGPSVAGRAGSIAVGVGGYGGAIATTGDSGPILTTGGTAPAGGAGCVTSCPAIHACADGSFPVTLPGLPGQCCPAKCVSTSG